MIGKTKMISYIKLKGGGQCRAGQHFNQSRTRLGLLALLALMPVSLSIFLCLSFSRYVFDAGYLINFN